MRGKGSFPGKRVFLGGLYFRENRARKAFGASVLKECELLTMHILKKSKACLAPLKYFFCAFSVVKRLCDIDQLQHGVEMGK